MQTHRALELQFLFSLAGYVRNLHVTFGSRLEGRSALDRKVEKNEIAGLSKLNKLT